MKIVKLVLLLLILSVTASNAAVIFQDTFSDGNDTGWTRVSDFNLGGTSVWGVSNGKYTNTGLKMKGFTLSYHRGAYSYLGAYSNLVDYSFSVKMTPMVNTRNTIGFMFRRVDNDNYYRFSISKTHNHTRLEKKVNGVFSTLAATGRGAVDGREYVAQVDMVGSRMFIYLDGDLIMTAEDSSVDRGTVAVFCLGQGMWDDPTLSDPPTTPIIGIASPLANKMATVEHDTNPDQLLVSALTANVPAGGSVRFVLDGVTQSPMLYNEPYSTLFTGVVTGYHDVKAIMYNSSGVEVASDHNFNVGTGGIVMVQIGDSISAGTYDDIILDDESNNGMTSGQGYAPILTNTISAHMGIPFVVINEAVGGMDSEYSEEAMTSILQRWPESKYYTINHGANDLSSLAPGDTCTEADLVARKAICVNTYKDVNRDMVLELKAAGKVPFFAKVTYSPPESDTYKAKRVLYNTVQDQLKVDHNLVITGPDFHTRFQEDQTLFAWDDIHWSGEGAQVAAQMWFDVLSTTIFDNGEIDPDPEPLPLTGVTLIHATFL